MDEIKRKTINLGAGTYRGVTYVDCTFTQCDQTIFVDCTFKDCKFLNNKHTIFKKCNLDARTKIHSHIDLKKKMAAQLKRMALSMRAHPDSHEEDSEFAGYAEGAMELLEQYEEYKVSV